MSQFQKRFRTLGLLSSSAAILTAACSGEPEDGVQLATSGSALATQQEVPVAENLRQQFPNARMQLRNDRVTRVYGTILASGDTPEQAAESLRTSVIRAHEAKQNDLRPLRLVLGGRQVVAKPEPVGLVYDSQSEQYKFWLYRYGQQVGGIPVHDAELLVLVKNEPGYPVVWANSSVRNIARFVPPAAPGILSVDRGKSLKAAQSDAAKKAQGGAAPSALAVFSRPELVVFAGTGDQDSEPRLAMRYIGETVGGLGKWRFVADARTGDVLDTEDLVQAVDVWGKVGANVTVEPVAADCAAEEAVSLPHSEVAIPAGDDGFTSALGYFYLTNPGAGPVQVVSTLHGEFFDVENWLGAEEELSITVTPPNPAYFLHNQADNSEHVIAQANAYYHVNLVHDFLLTYSPDYPVISGETDLLVIVNGDATYADVIPRCPGNAWHLGDRLLFCETGAGVRNTAFGTVAYHEYGHHIVQSGGSGQAQYGEGMADAVAVLVSGDSRNGVGWDSNDPTCQNFVRDADNDCWFDPNTCTTNCGGPSHPCGRLLSGVVWDLRKALIASHPADWTDILNPLVLDSIPMHTGVQINGDIATDMLTLDDNDGNINNGTPHSAEICAAFQAHGIDCPIIPTTPCAGICNNPIVFGWSSSYQSGALGTAVVCRETTQNVAGGNCGNLAGGRTLSVNGTVMNCSGKNWTSIPAKRNNGYCVTTTAGNYAWAYFTLW